MDESGFSNKEDYIWQKILIANPEVNIMKSEINFLNIDYNQTTVEAKSNSNYVGSVNFTYTTNFKIKEIHTNNIRVNSYAKEHDDSKTSTIKITPNLGKNGIVESYTKLNFELIGYTYDNKYGIDKIELNSINDIKKVGNTYVDLHNIFLDSGNENMNILNRWYSGDINWMHSSLVLTYKWLNNNFIISLKMYVSSYASWINAYYARSEEEFTMKNFKFIV